MPEWNCGEVRIPWLNFRTYKVHIIVSIEKKKKRNPILALYQRILYHINFYKILSYLFFLLFFLAISLDFWYKSSYDMRTKKGGLNCLVEKYAPLNRRYTRIILHRVCNARLFVQNELGSRKKKKKTLKQKKNLGTGFVTCSETESSDTLNLHWTLSYFWSTTCIHLPKRLCAENYKLPLNETRGKTLVSQN